MRVKILYKIECSCNAIGTVNNLGCDKTTGRGCLCKPNVYGHDCGRCKPGFYGLSENDPNGCKPCNCFESGSVRPWRCDELTGQCDCKRKDGRRYSGRKCNRLENLLICSQAEKKRNRLCDKCQCPNWNGKNYASSCFIDLNDFLFLNKSDTDQLTDYEYEWKLENLDESFNYNYKCNCLMAYTGERCTQCTSGHFGDPMAGIECKRCNCSGNINVADPGSCDNRTGRCLKCLSKTDGINCEKCRKGYFGNAIKQDCKRKPYQFIFLLPYTFYFII